MTSAPQRTAGSGSAPVRGRQTLPWHADPYSDALRAGRGPLFLRRSDGGLLPLDVERWCAEPDAADRTVLARCRGTVLDIGCGPGRLVRALTRAGHRTLGIDVSPAAVTRTVRAGGRAREQSVFDPVPDEGGWDTGLLIDGNIGIGGDPRALLDRAARILSPSGALMVETALAAGDSDLDERFQARVDDGRGTAGAAFTWARLSCHALNRYGRTTGWTAAEHWTEAGRHFVVLRRGSGGGDGVEVGGSTGTGIDVGGG
ncbi:class I SAM-dependent methyltransferase [Streptomyces corynorhini]|uniref:class I SAM-dependent methyltransferase n=1 Tax=Streptomyces corynorhini TaxID=2282652 RepID=UPI0026794304